MSGSFADVDFSQCQGTSEDRKFSDLQRMVNTYGDAMYMHGFYRALGRDFGMNWSEDWAQSAREYRQILDYMLRIYIYKDR